MLIKDWFVDLLMEKKQNSSFLLYLSYSVTAIMFLTILLVATSIVLPLISLELNQNQIAIAQHQQPQVNLTSVEQQHYL